jgi:membrane-associated phospholipid phosphatase
MPTAVAPVRAPATLDVRVRPPVAVNRLLVAIVLLAVPVLAITQDVLTDGPLRRLDDVLAYQGWHQADPMLVTTSKLLDLAGQRAYVCTLLVVVAAVLALRRRTWRPLVVTGVGLVLLNGVVGLLKIVIGRTEPSRGHDLLFTLDQQFPSGHAANAALSWGLLVWLVVRYGHTGLRAVPAFWAAGVLSVAVCLASLYLGYHWLTDLLAGLPLGALLALVTITWDVRTQRGSSEPER